MKDLWEASYILGIKLLQDRKNKTLALSQTAYIDKILARFGMELHSPKISRLRHLRKEKKIKQVPYAKVVGSLMYTMLCTRLDICFVVRMVSRYQFNISPEHWTAVKHMIKYFKRTKNYMLGYSGDDLIPVSYTDSDFMSDKDFKKSTSDYVFILWYGASTRLLLFGTISP